MTRTELTTHEVATLNGFTRYELQVLNLLARKPTYSSVLSAVEFLAAAELTIHELIDWNEETGVLALTEVGRDALHEYNRIHLKQLRRIEENRNPAHIARRGF